ncbi:hypothetical protein PsorP6_005795 [Peronosclerospora sorghi]|uniref:Uncharacterized protein n=1 Tax=Peronosclerospora sorghi TaxID=230839 RepID=A0ACC0W7A7_9STRA|nr:hypothetical protein PsorP6_005795 [Peronosclerospora sorghi]
MRNISGAFKASEDGRVMINNGFFSCVMQDTQRITTRGETCRVFVMCCTWQPLQALDGHQTQATWYVSQRFRQFEKLHKILKRKFARSSAVALPPFPAKYHLIDQREKRMQGLATYMARLLEMCASLPTAQPVPELDEFLDISHQIQFFRSQRSSFATAPTMSAASRRLDVFQRSASTSALSRASSISASSGTTTSQSFVSPMDETELAQAEGAVRLLAQAVRNARGDVRTDGTVQHHLDVCVQLAPGLQSSVDPDNPFANTELIPRALQCHEDLLSAFAIYNDSLVAILGITPVQPRGQPQLQVQAQAVPVSDIVPASAA